MNKQISLIHDLTPFSLEANCQAISDLFAQDELDTDALLKLVQERDELILKHLPTLQSEEKKKYINKELEVNNKLVEITSHLQKEQKQRLLGLVRGRSAVSKYK